MEKYPVPAGNPGFDKVTEHFNILKIENPAFPPNVQ